MTLTELTNQQLAASLRALADIYDASPTAPQILLQVYAFDKKKALSAIRLIGGKFRKYEDGDYLHFASERIPGFEVVVLRNLVCKKTVTWDCQPIFSPKEEAEIIA